MGKKRNNEIPPNLPMPAEDDLRLPPADPETEKFCLGSALLNPEHLAAVAAVPAEYFSTEAFRRVHARMKEMLERGETKIDRVTLANELRKFGQLESVGGIEALLALDEGLPNLPQIDSYLAILRDYAGRRKLIQLGLLVSEKAYRGEQSPTEILAEAEETWRTIESGEIEKDDGRQTPAQVVENYPGGISSFLDPSIRAKGLPTGFTRFDDMTAGLHVGEIYMIAARPGVGKTSWGLNVAEHLVLHPSQRRHVAIFSLEMTSDSLITRMACARARVNATRFRRGNLDQGERRRLQVGLSEILDARLSLYDRASMSIGELCRNVKKLMDKQGLHLLIVDYIQLMGSRKSENRNQELGHISREFKLLAKDCGIPILLLSQLSRVTERRGSSGMPQLGDLRDSGNLEEDSTLVGFLYREEMYKKERHDLKGIAELIIAKHRNGELGSVPLRFLGQYTRFENRSEDEPPAGNS